MIRAVDKLAGFVNETRDRDIPEAVLARASDSMLDALGSAAASTRAMSRTLPLREGTAPLWFTDRTGDPITAATLILRCHCCHNGLI